MFKAKIHLISEEICDRAVSKLFFFNFFFSILAQIRVGGSEKRKINNSGLKMLIDVFITNDFDFKPYFTIT